MITFDRWILAAAPSNTSKATATPFRKCALAGKEKYIRYLFGCQYKLGTVGATRKKWHRAYRYSTLNKAFFAACRNYWCARRALVRWRERRMQERGSGTTLAGDPLSGLPSCMMVRIVDGQTKHTFYIRDLLTHIQTRLFNSDYFIPEPLTPTNPLTGLALSESSLMRIFLLAFSPQVYVPLHKVLLTYWRVGLSLGALQQCEQVMLHEMAIVNEPRQAGNEMLDDLYDMYREAGMDAVVPSLVEAEAIGSLGILLATHQQSFQSYYLMNRSWCHYMTEFARKNLATHCTAALADYLQKTFVSRMRYLERSHAQEPPPPPSWPVRPLRDRRSAVVPPPPLALEEYEDDEDSDSIVLTLPEDLELV